MERRRQAGMKKGVFLLLHSLLLAQPCFAAESLNLLARRGDLNDFAGMLSEAERRELGSVLESVKKDTAIELVIVTIPSYQPSKSLRQYAQALLQAWEVGKERGQRGVMIILAQQEKQVWVAAQPEVWAKLTEKTCDAILRDTVLPSLRKRAYARGLADGIIQIRGVLRDEARRSR
ncbi:MAG: TPM domain-containing protein [Candidatus Binatia bacterium]